MPEGIHQPLKQTVLSNSKALSYDRFLLVSEARVLHLSNILIRQRNSFLQRKVISIHHVIMELTDQLVPREPFTHHYINLLLKIKNS